MGRRLGQGLLTLQVSDSTDSRLLVGLYRCTELPGEFLWEPGLLTRAATQGLWLLVEDVDRTPQDLVSLLAATLKEGGLSVPALGGKQQLHPEFKLYLT